MKCMTIELIQIFIRDEPDMSICALIKTSGNRIALDLFQLKYFVGLCRNANLSPRQHRNLLVRHERFDREALIAGQGLQIGRSNYAEIVSTENPNHTVNLKDY